MIDGPKEYTPKQSAFLEALTGEARGSIRTAMTMAGYAKTTKMSEVVRPLQDEIIERASMMLAMNAPKAAFGIVGVLDDPSAMGARNSVAAAREILDRTGIVKREHLEVSASDTNLFILPPKKTNIDDMDTED